MTELIEKLAALVPPPRLNLIRYHGVLAPSARDREKIVPRTEDDSEPQAAPAYPHGPRRSRPQDRPPSTSSSSPPEPISTPDEIAASEALLRFSKTDRGGEDHYKSVKNTTQP